MTESAGRTALLQATIKVVAEGGLRALTYRAVAAAAGTSHGLVRHHFGSREKLIEEAMEYAIQQSLAESNMLHEEHTIAEFAAGIDLLSKQDAQMQAFQYELLLEARRRPELQRLAEMHNKAYKDALVRHLARFGVADSALADLIWAALDGVVFHQLIAPAELGPALERLREIIRHAVKTS